jgi:hypothetical protein
LTDDEWEKELPEDLRRAQAERDQKEAENRARQQRAADALLETFKPGRGGSLIPRNEWIFNHLRGTRVISGQSLSTLLRNQWIVDVAVDCATEDLWERANYEGTLLGNA